MSALSATTLVACVRFGLHSACKYSFRKSSPMQTFPRCKRSSQIFGVHSEQLSTSTKARVFWSTPTNVNTGQGSPGAVGSKISSRQMHWHQAAAMPAAPASLRTPKSAMHPASVGLLSAAVKVSGGQAVQCCSELELAPVRSDAVTVPAATFAAEARLFPPVVLVDVNVLAPLTLVAPALTSALVGVLLVCEGAAGHEQS
eukprot:CAMPEP_0115185784 /NCGR_PEP_ID=MMETSP0270-20121206/9649_1 /TAXON_ID=71861 /ORGANISM="Scrippsiella trochoidea, Strain CCMP3099" /LENGTH=199 /DNA_ID=CAMNT_0002598897 /DNA_START=108 /DNA_END=706 /DNA_ORIENTATION=-